MNSMKVDWEKEIVCGCVCVRVRVCGDGVWWGGGIHLLKRSLQKMHPHKLSSHPLLVQCVFFWCMRGHIQIKEGKTFHTHGEL